MKIVKQVTLECAVVDDAHWFKLGYSADLHTHLMVVSVAWVAGYERYYRMGADDLRSMHRIGHHFTGSTQTRSGRAATPVILSD